MSRGKYPRVAKGGPLVELIPAVSGTGSSCADSARLTEVGCHRPELNAWIKEPVRKGWEYGKDQGKAWFLSVHSIGRAKSYLEKPSRVDRTQLPKARSCRWPGRKIIPQDD